MCCIILFGCLKLLCVFKVIYAGAIAVYFNIY